jgi:hypothetical protein
MAMMGARFSSATTGVSTDRDRLGDFERNLDRREQDGRVSGFGQFYRFRLRIDEFLTPGCSK